MVMARLLDVEEKIVLTTIMIQVVIPTWKLGILITRHIFTVKMEIQEGYLKVRHLMYGYIVVKASDSDIAAGKIL